MGSDGSREMLLLVLAALRPAVQLSGSALQGWDTASHPPEPDDDWVPRIRKRLAVTPAGACFHNLECASIQADRKIVRPCNNCRP